MGYGLRLRMAQLGAPRFHFHTAMYLRRRDLTRPQLALASGLLSLGHLALQARQRAARRGAVDWDQRSLELTDQIRDLTRALARRAQQRWRQRT